MMTSNKTLITVSLLIALLVSSCEKAFIIMSGDKPTIEIVDGKAHVNGILGKTFFRILEKFVEDNPDITTLVLEDVPGSANDEWNVRSCLLIYENGLHTELKSYSEIASGGVDLFVSGNSRTIEEGAKIGVHSWSDGKKEGSEYPRDSEEHDIFLDLFEQIGMDTAFYWFTLEAAPADGIHWMTQEEIDEYGLEKP